MKPPDFMRYTQYFGVKTTGSRIGLCTCRECGATVMLGDDQADGIALHDEWHRRRTPEEALKVMGDGQPLVKMREIR